MCLVLRHDLFTFIYVFNDLGENISGFHCYCFKNSTLFLSEKANVSVNDSHISLTNNYTCKFCVVTKAVLAKCWLFAHKNHVFLKQLQFNF